MSDFSYKDLLRYPAIVVSIFLGLLLAKWFLGIDFSRIVEIGPGGLKLAEVREDAAAAATSLEERLDDAMARIAALEEATGETEEDQDRVVTEANEPSEAVANLSRTTHDSGTLLKGKRGWIWIGDFDSEANEWERRNLLRANDRTAIARPINELLPGSQFRVARNTFLRFGKPENNAEYFRGQKAIGAIPNGTLLTLQSEPVSITRGARDQYWAEVKVEE